MQVRTRAALTAAAVDAADAAHNQSWPGFVAIYTVYMPMLLLLQRNATANAT
jgi:hypothetical protein